MIYEISQKQLNYDINQTKVTYFECEIDGLKGYAVINEIYINLLEQDVLYTKLLRILSEENSILVLKMNFLRLILHEMTHVALRATTQDFNPSTPTLIDESNKNSKEKIKNCQAGILAEKKFFSVRIDWFQSARKGLNFNYCQTFLKNLPDNSRSILILIKQKLKLTKVSSHAVQ